ncbi:hypothetical protein ASG31_12915 [Chryseobacterium sp. Leaf404]|uniref:hypothetical protein n=1 Tax=unclassified Chryseobacterium TaxID=2593645 RepID=UPI0006FD49B6|nr:MULTISPECIES: hypothetical protein [unclassified Chryseobacterium]KQT16412.1 hypothetical protein ASG31_12915 [Chryseobacterium sp. Leaf404]
MNFKKYFIAFAVFSSAILFAQNTRFTLHEKLDKIYSDLETECGKDYGLLDAKYKVIVSKSPDKKLSETDREEYLKEFDALKKSYLECLDDNRPIRIEKLKLLLAKVEKENIKEYIPPKNTMLPVPEAFSQDIIRGKLSDRLAGHSLFENLESTLKLKLTFVLDTDGQTKEAKITGTDDQEIKLFVLLSFYSVADVFKPKESNGKAVKEMYAIPLVMIGVE